MKGFGEQKFEEYQIFRQWMGWKWETVRFSKFSSKILADFSNQLENHEPKGHAFSLVLRALKAMPCNEFRLNHRFFCGLWLHMAVFYRKFRTIWGVQVSLGGFWQIFDPQNPLIDFVCFHRAFVWGLSVTASLRCLSHIENQMPNLSKSPSREMPNSIELYSFTMCHYWISLEIKGIFRSHLEAYGILDVSPLKNKQIWEIRDPIDRS